MIKYMFWYYKQRKTKKLLVFCFIIFRPQYLFSRQHFSHGKTLDGNWFLIYFVCLLRLFYVCLLDVTAYTKYSFSEWLITSTLYQMFIWHKETILVSQIYNYFIFTGHQMIFTKCTQSTLKFNLYICYSVYNKNQSFKRKLN